MTVNKLIYPAKQNAVQEKINEIIDAMPTVVSTVSSSSTNADAVGAKLFYDTVGNYQTIFVTKTDGTTMTLLQYVQNQ